MCAKARSLLLTLPLLAVCCGALAADVSGTWVISGRVEPRCTITQTGNQLSGTCKGPAAEGPLDGSSDGQAVQFTFQRRGLQGGQLPPVKFTGTVNGDSMTGTLVIGQAGGSPFAAQREGSIIPAAPAPQPALQAASAPPPLAIDHAPPKTVWDTDVDGSAIHQITGMVCPGASGAFKRTELAMYDKVGFDVSCNYRVAGGPDITIYLTMRDPALLQRDFDSARQAVTVNTPGAVPRDGTLAAPLGWQWLQAAFDEQGGTVRSDVLYAQLSGWEYEIRATFRPEAEAMVTAAIADLSATVRRTAGPHLAACSGTQPRDGAGPRNQNLEVLQALSAAAATIAKQTVTTPSPGTVWCADIGFGIGTGAYVWWHNITPADAGPVDRITNVAGGSTDFVVRVPAALGRALGEKMGGAGSLDGNDTYAVVVDKAQSTEIAGIFNGRPSFKDITGLVLERAFGVYASVKKPDGGITIYKPF